MPITKVKGPDGEIYNVSHPEGASESEIIQYAQIYGPTYDLPTITDSVGQIEQEEQEEFDRTFFGQVGESAKGVGRGFGRGLLSGLEGLAELADAATDYVGLEGLIDSGDENEIIRLARSGKDVVNKMLPTDQAYEDAWWTKFGEGLGSFGSFLVPGGAIKAVGLMPKLRALSQGGGKIREYGVLAAPASPLALGVGAQDQAERIQRARDSGVQVDDATADASVLMGGAIGLTELAPIGAVLKGLPKEVAQTPFFQSLLPRIKSALASGSLEGIQEVSARLLQDATERNMYNPNLQVGDSVWDEFTIGGSVGALADLTLNAFAGRKSYALKKEEIARIQSALEKRRKYLEEVANNPLIAQEIENIRGQSFTAMTTDPATGENILGTVVTDGSGNQIGPQFLTPQEAALFAYNLNNYVIDKSIERNIQSAVNSSGTSYSESQVNDLVNLGMKVFDLTSNTVTENALNFAFDPYLSSETSTLSAKEAIDAGVKPQDMTPAQRINAKRLNRGLPEVKEFTIPEVRSELKNNFDRIFSQQYVNLRGQSFEVQTRKKKPVVVSSFGEVIDSRPLMAEEKTADNYFGRKKFDNIEEATEYANYLNQKSASANPEESIQSIDQVIDPSQVTVKQLESLLRQKNIDADVNSKEFRALVEHYTGIKASGKTTVDKLNQNDLALLYTKIRELPTLNQFTAIPEFKVYPYGADHFSAAARAVMETGAMPTQQELINTVGPITKSEYDAIASDIQSNPRFQTSIETLAQETTDLYKSVQDALESSMKGFGLDDVKVNFLDSVRSARVGEAGETVFGARKERADTEVIEGSYKPSLNSVFIALDGIVADPRYRAAKESERDSVVEQLAVEILGHEVIHPARELDLFTAKEWETLSRKVGEISKGEDANYIDWSVRNYAAPGVTQETIVEEAVAEMMRDALAGKISLTGKPRSLIQRMINFIKGIVSFKNKTGYSRFEDVVEAFRVGEVGARQRGEIRTDVAIGKVEGTPIIQRPGVERQPDFIPDDEMFAVAELKKKNPELQGIQDQLGVSDEMFSRRAERAYEQGFDLDEIFYHGRLSRSDPIQSFALRPSRTPEVDVFVTALPEFADIFAEGPNDSLYDARTGKFENFTSTIYPLVLKKGLKFADLRDKDVIEKLRRTIDNSKKNESSEFSDAAESNRFGPRRVQKLKLNRAESYPESIDYTLLESLIPLIKEAGYDGYFDIETAGQGITGRAVFDGRNVKGLFARFDPESVPEGAAYEDDMMYAKRLEGMPETFMVDGQAIEFGYFDRALDAARSYEKRSGIPYVPLTEYAPVDESRAKKIAIEYEYMEHKPDDPEVRAAYEAMAQETLEQYKDILATGLNVRFIKGEDPYGNPRNAILDIYNNNNFFVFSTKDGFGADAETTIREQKDTNPMLRDSGFKTSDGDPMLVNDVFRVVHDYFGHAKNGVGFRARGEENAWQSHASMYSPLARRAMTTETRGQNSWVNFGPEAEYNRTASPADTIYADQKIGLLPIWVSEEGRLSADSQQRANRDFTDGLEGAIDPNGRLLLTHYSTEVFERLDPSKAGAGADYIKFRRQWNPKATYYGIVKAIKDGYRKESKVAPGAGAIEYTASIDPYLIYPADKNPYNLWVPGDYPQSIRNMKDAGYSGYRSNNPSLGKVAVLWDSLPIDSSEPLYGRKDDESFSRRTKRSLPKDQVEQAVKKNIEEFNSSDGRAIPAVNVFASPDAQYIADNPDAALEIPKDDVVYSRRRPSFGGSVDNIIEEVGGSPLTGRTPFDSYEEASGAVASPSRLNYLLTKAKQEAVNRYARLEQLNYSTELRENLADTSSISAALQADKAMAIVSAAFKYGIPVYKNGTFMVVDDASAARLGIASPSGRPIKSLMEIMNQLFDTTVEDGDYTALAKTYAAALRTERLMRQGITKHPGKLDQSQINEIKAVVDGLTDPATGKNIVKDWYRDWQDYNTAVITMMQDAGILTDETADLWRNWSDYIPFYRFSEGSAKTLRSDVKGIGEKVFGGMNVISQMKRLKGSEEGLNMDLIDAVTMNLTAAVQMSMKNVAQQRIARDMIQLGLAKQLRPNESGISTAEFRVNGKNTKVEIYDPLIYESMMPLSGTEIVQMVRETFGIPATFLREMITRDPGFIIANLFRDSLSTFVTSGTNMTPIVDTFASYFGDMKELEMLGVIGGYDLNALPSEIGSSSRLARLFASNKGPREFFEMETQRAGMGPKGSASSLNLFKRLWDAAGRATSRSDGATRRAVFNDVYARTGNLAEAAFQAQEIINFGRRGRSPAIRALTAVIPFLNARIQGVDVLWRGLTGRYTTRKDLNRTQVLMSALTRASLMATMTALYWALVRDDEQYEEAPDYLKDNYWIIPTPFGAPITLPVPFEVGFLFKTVPEAILDTSYGDRTNRELRETVKRGLQSTFELSPFSIQAIGPLLEAGLNYNAYTGRRIVPFYVDEKITEGFQSTAYTNQLAKIIGESMNISPLKVEHVMQGYAGTLGQYFLDFIDRSLRSDYAGEGAVLPAMRFYDYPFAKRFFGRVADRGLQEDAYDIYRQVDVVYNTIERLKKEGKVDELFAYLKARENLLGMRGSMNNLKSYLDKVRRYKKTVIESDLSAEEKRKQIEEADMILNAALREVIPYLKNVSDMPLKAFEPLYYE